MNKSLCPGCFAFVLAGYVRAQDAAPADPQVMEGKKNYMTICFACHQPTGLGIPMVFPPLAKIPYVNGNPERFRRYHSQRKHRSIQGGRKAV